jgi:hypothetical protein
MPGYTQTELDDAQAKWNLTFPPDLVAIFRERRSVIEQPGPIDLDWTQSPKKLIGDRLAWPLESFWFDVKHNGIWWPEWGAKPAKPDAQFEALRAAMDAAPRLIPLYSHRFLPQEPFEAGNPVFSVYQTDVTHYGANLADYIQRELGDPRAKVLPPCKEIPFWTRAVERAGGEAHKTAQPTD